MDAQRVTVTAVDDAGPIQQVDCQGTDRIKDAERLQPFGLTGVPVAGEGLVIRLTPDHGVAFVDDPTLRPTGMAAGDVTIYDGHGNRIDLRAGGITITAAGTVTVDATSIDLDSGAGTFTRAVMVESTLAPYYQPAAGLTARAGAT